METAGRAQRAQLGGRGGGLVRGTYAATGLSKPNLYRQTTRHEVAVAAASARYAVAGHAWQRDEKPAHVGGHQADGVALGFGWVELIEVEPTPKRLPRCATIFIAYRHTAASLAVQAVANVEAVQRMLGHASAAMTLDVYADLFDDDLDLAGAGMDDGLLRTDVGKMWANRGSAPVPALLIRARPGVLSRPESGPRGARNQSEGPEA
jgi:hypothetical protein